MATRPSILLVEAGAPIDEEITVGLRDHGFGLVQACAPRAAGARPDVVLLRLAGAGAEDARLLRAVRAVAPCAPVIALLEGEEAGSALAAGTGAFDDFVTAPFSVGELVLRIRTQLHPGNGAGRILAFGDVELDVAGHRASVRGRDVALAAREVTLLAAFLRHPNRVLTRSQLLRLVWRIDFDPRSNVVDVYVSSLRRKLGKDVIETVRGAGYRLPAALAT